MNDEAGFLKAIADQPAERSTRLVYADWLDEHGRPREAEFLRLQIQFAEMNARLTELGGELDGKWLTAIGNVRWEPDWITLHSGRRIRLCEFRQWRFYEGLLAGYPTSDDNRESLERLLQEERNRHRLEPYLISPVERPAPARTPPRSESCGLFPAVACVGRFTSYQSARDPNLTLSELTMIWFQYELAFPIDPGVREQIRAIDWDSHAHDFDW